MDTLPAGEEVPMGAVASDETVLIDRALLVE